jgi:hypothetical protein
VVLGVIGWVVITAVTVIACVVLFLLGLVAPRRAVRAQNDVDDALLKGEDKAGDKAPDPVDGWVRKPFQTSRKATDESAEAGRKSRFRLPF